MTAYAFFEVTLIDDATPEQRERYDLYRQAVPALVERFGGRYIARAWQAEVLEGDAAGDRFHLIEFDEADSARAMWTSAEYGALKEGRQGAVDVRALLISPADA
jgi:uncharacterized protein (DUF1330 family)